MKGKACGLCQRKLYFLSFPVPVWGNRKCVDAGNGPSQRKRVFSSSKHLLFDFLIAKTVGLGEPTAMQLSVMLKGGFNGFGQSLFGKHQVKNPSEGLLCIQDSTFFGSSTCKLLKINEVGKFLC
ncbi:hypothetical protein B7P33_00705 [Sediminicola luteus]|uniref:Uncharacterized protein n=1 Tax=Sediminicola luteus TaxID=319238 RepID=A0A2A4GDJ3_9FLAO|nr:hypothetical protein B7P33_00705 [Sediminicola luteus]